MRAESRHRFANCRAASGPLSYTELKAAFRKGGLRQICRGDADVSLRGGTFVGVAHLLFLFHNCIKTNRNRRADQYRPRRREPFVHAVRPAEDCAGGEENERGGFHSRLLAHSSRASATMKIKHRVRMMVVMKLLGND